MSPNPTSRIPLILLPGLLNDARLWRAQTDDTTGLADIASCAVAPLTGSDTMAGLAAAVLAGATARGFERFALAGLSMGGYVALEIMRQAPGRVRALALVDTQSRPDTPAASEGRRALMQRADSDFGGVIATLYPRLVHPDRAEDAGLRSLFADMAHTVGAEAFKRQQTAILNRIDSRPSLAEIACPVLVLCGREDGVTPVALHEEMAAAIAGSRLQVIEQCGHLSALERPEAVTAALRAWLTTV